MTPQPGKLEAEITSLEIDRDRLRARVLELEEALVACVGVLSMTDPDYPSAKLYETHGGRKIVDRARALLSKKGAA
jgi:hypothetical protein